MAAHGGLLFGRRLALVALFPFIVGHAVDELTRLVLEKKLAIYEYSNVIMTARLRAGAMGALGCFSLQLEKNMIFFLLTFITAFCSWITLRVADSKERQPANGTPSSGEPPKKDDSRGPKREKAPSVGRLAGNGSDGAAREKAPRKRRRRRGRRRGPGEAGGGNQGPTTNGNNPPPNA